MLTKDQFEVLRKELASDAYAALVKVGNDQAVADLLNTLTDELIPVEKIPADTFRLAVVPIILALGQADDAIKAKWETILTRLLLLLAGVRDDVTITDASIGVLLAMAVADKLRTQEDVDAITHRKGARGEVLFGVGFVATARDCSQAR